MPLPGRGLTARKRSPWVLVGVSLLALALWLFPGKRLGLALTIATGIGQAALQARIDDAGAQSHPPREAV